MTTTGYIDVDLRIGMPMPAAPGLGSEQILPSRQATFEWWFCSGCRRPIARHAIRHGSIQIRCRSCKTMNSLTMFDVSLN